MYMSLRNVDFYVAGFTLLAEVACLWGKMKSFSKETCERAFDERFWFQKKNASFQFIQTSELINFIAKLPAFKATSK